MDGFKPYAVFAETVRSGSMSEAGRRLGMSPSAISQTISILEKEAGVTLLSRSTRKLSLTEAGERCYPYCLRLLEAAKAAKDSLDEAREAPVGELRVAAPVGFAAHIAPALAPVLAKYPQLRLKLLVDDEMVDLIKSRIDIAIRVGRMPDSSWITRRLGELEMILCASPHYIERNGLPAMPNDLSAHKILALAREAEYTQRKESGQPQLAINLYDVHGSSQSVHADVRIESNNQIALQQMCEHGLGVAKLSYLDVIPALQRGTLIHILPQWRFAPAAMSAVTVKRSGEPAKISVAIAALKQYFATLPNRVG